MVGASLRPVRYLLRVTSKSTGGEVEVYNLPTLEVGDYYVYDGKNEFPGYFPVLRLDVYTYKEESI